ncbi:hypothetical protein EII20_03130 [Comamonadaceae bacterium OH2545_COT-014]|nr:hypothetical protein EII20_03130 [Comamonadaceae bacterium OH2545_COT-014]
MRAVHTAQSAIFLIAIVSHLLAGCATWQDAPRLAYQCPHDLRFEARLYQDMALLEGQRGHAVLQRAPDGPAGELRYRDATLLAEFGLGAGQRLTALHYTGIPETVRCERVPLAAGDGTASPLAPVRPAPRDGPKPAPPPPDPDAPVQTNIRLGDGPWPD